jgi:hypothetical protein
MVEPFVRGDMSAKLKLLGVDVASFGAPHPCPHHFQERHDSDTMHTSQISTNACACACACACVSVSVCLCVCVPVPVPVPTNTPHTAGPLGLGIARPPRYARPLFREGGVRRGLRGRPRGGDALRLRGPGPGPPGAAKRPGRFPQCAAGWPCYAQPKRSARVWCEHICGHGHGHTDTQIHRHRDTETQCHAHAQAHAQSCVR